MPRLPKMKSLPKRIKQLNKEEYKNINVYTRGSEKINFRNFGTSDINYTNAGFKPNATFDLYDNSGYKIKEIKFITK